MSEARGTPFRHYELLFRAMNEVLAVLSADGDERQALEASFRTAAEGFGAANALLLVEEPEPLRLRSLLTHGKLTKEQIATCEQEQGLSVKGVSPSVIRRVVETRTAELIRDSRAATWIVAVRLKRANWRSSRQTSTPSWELAFEYQAIFVERWNEHFGR